MIDFSLIIKSLPNLLKGTLVSLQITFIAAFFGLIGGSLLGIASKSKNKSLKIFVEVYVTLFRGTPMLVQILFVYYVLPQFGVMLPAFWAASMAIGLNSAAYISQIIKTGLNNVSKGQIEAAYTLGFSSYKTMKYIVFPQAFRSILPSLGNELITLVKDSSLASIIGVMELTKEASVIRSRTYDAFSILLAVAIIYLCLTATLSFIIRKFEKEFNHA